MKNIRILSENFNFLMVRFSVYLNSLVFVMDNILFIFGVQSIQQESHVKVHILALTKHLGPVVQS